MATIGRYYFRVCTEGAERRGVDADALLEQAGLCRADLDTPGWRGSAVAMAGLVRAVWNSLNDEWMGYTALPVRPGALAFACELALECETVADGLMRAARFYNILNDGIHTQVEDGGEGLAVTVRFDRPELDPKRYFSEFWMIIWHRLACWLANETVPMLSAEFDYRPAPEAEEEFRYMFPGKRRFDTDRRRLLLDRHVLHAPIRRSPQELREMIAAAPVQLMTIPASDNGLALRARSLLFRDPALPLDRLAEALSIAPEKLAHRLKTEGATLSSLRQNVRRDKALRWLTTSNRSVERIAWDLGYAEPRSFTRAFSEWFGCSPSAYRRGRVIPGPEEEGGHPASG
ncbi:AraC family transcriptional regulator [Sphingobium sp. Sx8-8]|uniref:AraC family transcriptional regulator n=1 Tax=Sphingobium sp. Sx8-8 TaxID=2933617 RepID=UPI001F57B2F7|nr:AraC family transcriptional regulator [Sphingobium sp. Sx8-8]